MKQFKIAILTFILFLGSFQPSLASTVLFQDNFDDGEFSDWIVKRNQQWANLSQPCWYNGVATNWQLRNGELGMEIFSNPCISEIVPKNVDLTNVPSYEYEFDWSFPESIEMDRSAIFLWQDSQNWYNVKVTGKTIQVQKVVAGKQHFLANDTATYDFVANQKYRFKIAVTQKQKISIAINNMQVLELNDVAPFITGTRTLGLQAGVGANPKSISFFDNIEVRSVPAASEKNLNVSIFKQIDPSWKDQEYDSANKWSDNPGIGRWGCAMTSMAMVMKYYGMHTLPDGTVLNPSSLNTWLKSQADGYTKSGGINWIAATRLTKEIHQKLGTPKLEYSRLSGNIGTAVSEINDNRPVILEMPGHFLVGDGVTANQSDVHIKDPAYLHTLFSQHKTTLNSVRRFTPSFTDLSYLFFTHSPNVELLIKDSAGNVIPSQTFEEKITDHVDFSGQSTPTYKQTHFAKPNAGKYTVEMRQTVPGTYSLEAYSYDAAANPTLAAYTGLLGSTPQTIEIEYNKTGPSKLSPKVNFSSWRKDLLLSKDLKHLKNLYLYTKLDYTAKLAESVGRDRQLRYWQQLQEMIAQNSSSFTVEGKSFMNKQLEHLKANI